MGLGLTLVILTALLATPMGVLLGVALGAGLAFRITKGQSPLPPLADVLRSRPKVALREPPARDGQKRPPLPDVGA